MKLTILGVLLAVGSQGAIRRTDMPGDVWGIPPPSSMQLFVDALGRRHVLDHFPGAADMREMQSAIDHEIVMGASSRTVSVVGCTTYSHKGLAIIDNLLAAGIPTHVSYSSAAERRLCFVSCIQRTNPEDMAVLKSVRAHLALLVPIPSVLKLETSLVHALDWIASSATSSHPRSKQATSAHPILDDIAAGNNVTVTVTMRDDWHIKGNPSQSASFAREAAAKVWSRVLAIHSSTELEAEVSVFWNRFFWTRTSFDSGSNSSNNRREIWLQWKNRAGLESGSRITNAQTNSAPAGNLCASLIQARGFRKNTLEFELDEAIWTPGQAHCLALLVAMVASHESVSRIALSRPIRLLNDFARGIVQSGRVHTEPFSQVGLDGTGQIVGIADTGIDENSCFFRDDVNGFVPLSSIDDPRTYPNQRKIVQYLNYSGSGGDLPDGHGSHVAASVAGNCIDPLFPGMKGYHGMAPGAKIAFFDIMDDTTSNLYVPNDLAHAMFRTAYSGGARLYSNSWGGSYWYDAFAIEVDDFSYKNPEFLAIFAAGNDGSLGLRSVLSPAMAKNAVAVAASNTGHASLDDILEIPSFSAKGPAPDGRIKPDVTVPGASIISAKASKETHLFTVKSQSCLVEPKTGTSMAAPVCAGHAAMIRQYFADKLFWNAVCNNSYPLCSQGAFSPPGYLVKAVLLNAGTDLRYYIDAKNAKVPLGESPDVFQGYGRVNLGYTLPLVRYVYQQTGFDLLVDINQVESYTEAVYEVHVLESTAPLRATLCWYDPPNEEFVARVLLHDLDLIFIDPHGAVFYGNAANRDGTASFGVQRDELNSNEQITITAPKIGKWLVKIQGKLLSQTDVQKFAIAISHAGYVVVPSLRDQLLQLEPNTFDNCHSSPLSGAQDASMVSIELSLWSLVAKNGWNSGEHYMIAHDDKVTFGTHVISGSFAGNSTYELQSQCLYTGCYEFSMNFGIHSSPGTLMSLPICGDVLFTPLSPKQTLCFSTERDIFGYQNVVCQKKAPMPGAESSAVFNVALVEDAGAGWSGGFYSVFQMPLPADNSTSLSHMNSAATLSSTMNWGFELILPLHLPLKPSCHMMKLSLPRGVQTAPMIFFDNTSMLISETDRNYLRDSQGQTFMCPFYMNATNAFAKICTEAVSAQASPRPTANNVNVDISFYHSRLNASWALSLGTEQTLRQEYQWATARENLTFIGICRQVGENITTFFSPRTTASDPIGASPLARPTHAPVVNPTRYPSLQPTILPAPTATGPSNFFPHGFDFACFADCPAFPRGIFSAQQACEFLVSVVYSQCGSYGIASDECHRLPCANRCSPKEWCFFGSATIDSCTISPDTGVQFKLNPVVTFALSQDAIAINKQCLEMAAQKNQNQGNGTNVSVANDQGGITSAAQDPLSTPIMVVLVLAQMFLICCAVQWLRGLRPTCPPRAPNLSGLLRSIAGGKSDQVALHMALPNDSGHSIAASVEQNSPSFTISDADDEGG